MNRKLWCLPIVMLLASSFPAWAQIRPFNDAGVAAGHEHLTTRDPDAYNKFWIAMGGVSIPMGAQQVLKFPGVVLMAQRARGGATAVTVAPSEGSTVDSMAFKVKSLKGTLAALDAVGIQPQTGASPRQAIVMSPDGVKVLLAEDPSLATPIASDEVVMKVPGAAEASAWYAKWFGASIVREGQGTVARIPGMNIRFVETSEAMAPTIGRAIDHIGFEVKNLEPLMKKITEAGISVTTPYGPIPVQLPPLRTYAFIVDPWGTRIELNEGFVDVK